ncbi:MAG: helix-turn-helix transcriptional regulator [Candidatus Heimdallarchaeota archaeon]|nr:helix-turn-helix transcriptional regulator [Candidatus Heimdallarchaeota archaeon]
MSTKKEKKLKTKMKVFRAIHELTQNDLAQLAGVRRETISYIERGKYSPSLRLAFDLSQILQTSMDELFTFE